MGSIRNIGILAHVDAGKTTLTEQILFKTGAVRRVGRVDQGTAHTDTLPIERQRGISVRAQEVCVGYAGADIRIIDTPGHVDFSQEVENALLALDGAVLVVSAVEGVQAQTEVIARVLRENGIPMIVFINKIDRAGADIPRVLMELSRLTEPLRVDADLDEQVDILTRHDEALLAFALEEGLWTPESGPSQVEAALRRACHGGQVAPVVTGSALRGEGVAAVLDAILRFLPPPEDVGEFSAVAYHIARADEERQVFLRMFGGTLRIGQEWPVGRVKRLRALTREGIANVPELRAGDIGQVVGLDGLQPGDWLGKPGRGRMVFAHAVLRAQVEAEDPAQADRVRAALTRMADEQPVLSPRFEPRSRQLWVQVMGEVHREVIEQTLWDAYGLRARLTEPSVLYREAASGVGEGGFNLRGTQWDAQATFRVEPGAPGSGLVYRSAVHVDLLHIRYQREIEKTVYEALAEGIYGWPVTDTIVTLIDGSADWQMWPGSDFGPVVPLGLFQALKNAGMRLLEPIQVFEAQVDSPEVGRLLYDLERMQARYDPPGTRGERVVVRGEIPVRTSMRYPEAFRELTHGMGIWHMRVIGYAPSAAGHVATVPRTTPDPLNAELYMKIIRGVVRG